MVILIREDLNLSVGKLAAQVAHAAVQCTLHADRMLISDWMSLGAKKVVLKVKNEAELSKYLNAARESGLKTQLITDAGRNEVDEGTETCVGIGPAVSDKIDEVTGMLDMYE